MVYLCNCAFSNHTLEQLLSLSNLMFVEIYNFAIQRLMKILFNVSSIIIIRWPTCHYVSFRAIYTRYILGITYMKQRNITYFSFEIHFQLNEKGTMNTNCWIQKIVLNCWNNILIEFNYSDLHDWTN